MKYMNVEELTRMKLNLQFFAEGGESSGDGGESTENNNDDSNNNEDQNSDKSGEKTFTQSELSAVAATEKKQGKQSILNLFGLKSEKEAKEQAEAFKKWQDSQKTTETKLKDQEVQISEANAKAALAESKLACIMAGVSKDSVDDAMAIAATKVTEDKDLTAVLEEMKKEPRYKGFFGTTDSSSSNGTGSPAGHQGTGSTGAVGNIGERLGKAKHVESKKSNYFTN